MLRLWLPLVLQKIRRLVVSMVIILDVFLNQLQGLNSPNDFFNGNLTENQRRKWFIGLLSWRFMLVVDSFALFKLLAPYQNCALHARRYFLIEIRIFDNFNYGKFASLEDCLLRIFRIVVHNIFFCGLIAIFDKQKDLVFTIFEFCLIICEGLIIIAIIIYGKRVLIVFSLGQ